MRYRNENDQFRISKPVNVMDGIQKRNDPLPRMDVPYKPAVLVPETPTVRPPQANTKKFTIVVSRFTSLGNKFTNLESAHGLAFRVLSASLALLLFSTFILEVTQPKMSAERYDISSYEGRILKKPVPQYADKLKTDPKDGTIKFNVGYQPGQESAGQSGMPKIGAEFATAPGNAVTVQDPISKVDVTFKPKFKTDSPKKDINRVVYPMVGTNGKVVYTLKGSAVKEDIVLDSYHKDQTTFTYELGLENGLEARLEKDGSIGVYGVSQNLLGEVSTSTEKDAELLQKARKNGKKDNLLFRIPAPVVVEANKKVSNVKSWFSLDGNDLSVHASGLKTATYPLSIDPSVYVETAAKLMKGNNESNIDFDVDNELIQKGQTTGARINAWEGTQDMSQATWNGGTAAAGGYVYRVGGSTGPTKPQIVDSRQSLAGSNTSSFIMDMPTTSPAGDLYIAVMCHDGSNGSNVTAPSGGGWTEYADLQGFAAYYKIGTDEGSGNEATQYTWTKTGGTEEWAGTIMRITGFDSTDPVSGTPGTGSSGSSTVPVFPATTPDNDATLVVRATGFDQDNPSATGWVPGGHTKIGSSSSSGGGNNSCGYAAASLDTPPLSGVSTGTQTLVNDGSISDDYGAASIAINPASTTSAVQNTVYWASFNSTTRAIDSPNPGNGVCSGWCTNSAYNLPEGRIGYSLVAYNGFLYAMGGSDGTTRKSTVYIAKLGANGEPAKWHPSDTNKNNWVYWYSDSGLNGATARSYHAAVAYNNKMYVLGGQTNASAGGVTTVEMATINPQGTLSSWTTTGMQALPDVRHGHSVHVYNDVMYLIGGNSNGTLRNTVYYSKLTSTGTMNTWTATSNFTTARTSQGGVMTSVWGGYVYIGGGCTAVNGSGYCTSIATDTQLASINADGTLSEWNSILNLQNERVGYSFISWQGGMYRLGGCARQNTSTGNCASTLADVDYGVINEDGDASTVNQSVDTATAPCSGSNYNCDLPGTTYIGNMQPATAVMNGYLYVIGGCTNNGCSTTIGNVAYQSIGSDGTLQKPATCPGGTYRGNSYCVDSTNTISGGVAAAGTAIFNGRIYLVGGTDGSNLKGNIYYNSVNNDGSLSGAWTAQTTASIGATSIKYGYTYARANPASAGSNPGNLYIFGGCTTGGDLGCGSYTQAVYKCNIGTTGAIGASSCTTTGQLQIGTLPGASGVGIGAHTGTVYANYIYLIGGLAPGATDLKSLRYAKFDNNNNVVTVGSGWVQSTKETSIGRRRAASFGYNGYIYVVGGFNASSGVLADIQFAKVDVSTGDIGAFSTSGVTINQRWGLSVPVSNSYAYVIGGCTVGDSPSACTSRTDTIQTFQIYNNDSGALKDITAAADDDFSTDANRWGASSAIVNGYIYVAGGCTSATDCTTATANVQKAKINDANGSIDASWANVTTTASMPDVRAWGKLVTVGGYLYYLGGQTSTSTAEQSTIYYAQPSAGAISSWSTALGGIGDTASQAAQERTKFSAAVWNNRIYVVGGLDASAAVTSTVFVSPNLSSGGGIAADSWTSSTAFNVARYGAALTAYANNLYLLGGNDGTNYLNDTQYASIGYKTGTISQSGTTVTGSGTTFTSAMVGSTLQYSDGYSATITGYTNATSITVDVSKTVTAGSTYVIEDGSVGAWSYSTSLPGPVSQGEAFSANGYIYLVGGRSAASTCVPNTIVAPVSANTTIATGNNPTGVGEWFETNVRYTGDRYGPAVAYSSGKLYLMGGGCTSPLSSTRSYYGTLKSQPQIARYSRIIDTDTDVFPNSWLMNGLDNSTGARWFMRYSSMNDTDGIAADCGSADMSTWGTETDAGEVSLGKVGTYVPRDGSNNNINCARYFYFSINIDSSQAFGYPEDVIRGPTISDLSLFFTADPSKRLRHGKTFTGGQQQPLNTPCRVSGANPSGSQPNCPNP